MIVDWSEALIGFTVGTVVSILYFVALALSVRVAMNSSQHLVVLLPSAFLRVGFLLVIGWVVTAGALRLWAFIGYGVAFFLVRSMAIFYARIPRSKDA